MAYHRVLKLDKIPSNIDIFGSRRMDDEPAQKYKGCRFLVLVYAHYYRGDPDEEYLAEFDGIDTFTELDYDLDCYALRSDYPSFVGQEKFKKGY